MNTEILKTSNLDVMDADSINSDALYGCDGTKGKDPGALLIYHQHYISPVRSIIEDRRSWLQTA